MPTIIFQCCCCKCSNVELSSSYGVVWHSITGNPAPRYFYYSPLFPNPITCLRDIAATGSKEFYYRFIPWKGGEWIASTYKDTVTLFSFLDITIILLPMIVAIILTLFRITFNKGFKVSTCIVFDIAAIEKISYIAR